MTSERVKFGPYMYTYTYTYLHIPQPGLKLIDSVTPVLETKQS